MDLNTALAVLDQEVDRSRLFAYAPYPWQSRLHTAGLKFIRRMGMAGNRTGKTFCAAAETSFHATGIYPDWWDGWVLNKKSPLIWTGSMTNETSRDIVQAALLGEGGDGTGAIPARYVESVTYRQAGVKEVADQIKVGRSDATFIKGLMRGGISTISLKTYDQGWKKWQGKPVDFVWLDEEPDHFKIFTEAITRLTDTNGRMLVTFTPLSGKTDLVASFMDDPGAFVISATWDDAPHLDSEQKVALLAAIPEHEREARTKGVPMLGVGRVFTVAEDTLLCDPFDIPKHFVQIAGIDFGLDHPFGHVRLAHDRDKDILYITHAERSDGPSNVPMVHARMINGPNDMFKWIPVAWPHDGLQRGKADGIELQKHYRANGVNMMSVHAHYQPDPGHKPVLGAQPQEPIIVEFVERMQTGRLKVFRGSCDPWLEEFRSYHRDEKTGKPVPKNDDVLKASFYAAMMRRYARPGIQTVRKPQFTRAIQ